MKRRAHDVAVYLPSAASFYESGPGGGRGGGAELQSALLARELVARGFRVAHIVWPVSAPRSDSSAPTLVERSGYAGSGWRGQLAEARQIWGAMAAANARAYVFRGGGPQLLVAALFAGLRRRKLVFSAAIDLDFDFNRADRPRSHLVPYRLAVGRPDAIVVQTQQQLQRAREVLPRHRRMVVIPSFLEPASPTEARPGHFLWIGRVVDYKRPLEFARLAEAMPDASFTMVCLDTPETTRELWDAVHAEGRRIHNLEVLDQRPRDDVLEMIERSYAVVSTSRSEGMPNIFLEAWGRGIPTASLEYDPDGRIAKLELGCVAGNSLERMAEQLQRLQGDPEWRGRLGRNALEHVRALHDPAVVGGRWEALLRELLG